MSKDWIGKIVLDTICVLVLLMVLLLVMEG